MLQNHSKFVRRQAGESFEFSDGHHLLISGMGAGPKPILHLAIVPTANDQLARDIRQKLGIQVVRESTSSHGETLSFKQGKLMLMFWYTSTVSFGRQNHKIYWSFSHCRKKAINDICIFVRKYCLRHCAPDLCKHITRMLRQLHFCFFAQFTTYVVFTTRKKVIVMDFSYVMDVKST